MAADRVSLSSARSVLASSGDVGRDLLAVDWSTTSIGEPEEWPRALIAILRTMLGSRFSMWMAWGPELTFFCNEDYRRDTLGLKYPWALGKPAREVWTEIWPDIGPRIESVLRDETATWDEGLMLFLERAGYTEETYHTFSYSPLADDEGAVAGMLCVVAEVTERVIAERRMHTLNDLAAALALAITEEDLFSAVADVLSRSEGDVPFALAYLLEPDGTRAQLACSTGGGQVNPLAPSFLPGGDSEIDWLAAVNRVSRSATLVDLPEHWGTGGSADGPQRAAVVPLRGAGADAVAGFMVLALNPFRPPDAAHVGFAELIAGQVAAALANVRAYEAERRRAEQLADLDAAKTAFFTNISHEFRTPLTLMLSPLNDLLSTEGGHLQEADAERISLALRNGRRLLTLVNALLDFSRLEAGRLVPEPEPVDIAAETAEIASMFEPAIEAGGIGLEIDCPPLGRRVLVDPRMWEQIVTNLLSNAFKHTFEGMITVSLHVVGDTLELRVEDTGVGITVDDLPRIFERFHRVTGARARSGEGSGIGLALVQELVELLQGSISATSEPGRGTTFTVAIPVRWSDEPAGPPLAPRPASRELAVARVSDLESWIRGFEPSPERAGRPEVAAGAGHVLVVDDNNEMRGYLVRLLEGRFRVTAARDGAEALQRIRDEQPDLVVSDVMMPGIDGFELLRRIRAEGLDDLPVLLLSARAGIEASGEGLDLGADDYILKPFTADDLVNRVAARLTTGRQRRNRRLCSELAAALATVADHRQTVEAVQEQMQPATGAFNTSLALVQPDGEHVRFWHAAPFGHGIDERTYVVDLSADTPGVRSIQEGRRIEHEDAAAVLAEFPTFARDFAPLPTGARVSIPLVGAGGDVLGSLSFIWHGPREFSQLDRELHDTLAALIADAVMRVRAEELRRHVVEELQERMLSIERSSPVAAATVRYMPHDDALRIGGDWYDVLSLDGERVAVSVGDVVGSGLHAATVMARLRSALGIAAFAATGTDGVIDLVDAYASRLDEAIGSTLAYLTIDADRVLSWSCAGHPPPLLVQDDGVVYLTGGRRGPIGMPVPAGSAAMATRTLDPAATVLVYTDGLIERRGEPISAGLDRLAAAAATHRDLPLEQFCDALVDAMRPDGGVFTDDVALVALRTAGTTRSGYVDLRPATRRDATGARRAWIEWLQQAAPNASRSGDLAVAVGEAIANAVEHGSRFDSRRLFCVESVMEEGLLRVEVSDSGGWEDHSNRGPALDRGRGFTLMRELVDDVTVRRHRLGTTVALSASLPMPAARR